MESIDMPLIARQSGAARGRGTSLMRKESLIFRQPVISVVSTRSRFRLFGHDANDSIFNAYKMARVLFFEPDVTCDHRQNYKYYADQVIAAIKVLTKAYWPEQVHEPHIKLGRSGRGMHALFWKDAKESAASQPTKFSLKFEVNEQGIRLLNVFPGAIHRPATLWSSREAVGARDDDLARRIAQSTRCCSLFTPVARTYSETLSNALSARERRVTNTRDQTPYMPDWMPILSNERGGAADSVLGS